MTRRPLRLVLCDAGDPVARWLAGELTARAVHVELVTSGQILRADRLVHRVSSSGTDLEIDLADGRRLVAAELAGVVNRLVAVPSDPLGAAPADGEYARQERHALWLSFLAGLPCPVLNGPMPLGLSGVWLSGPEWVVRAARAGLPTAPAHFDSGGPVPDALAGCSAPMLVVAGAVFGPTPAAGLADGVRALAASVGADLLEVRLRRGAHGGLEVAGATTLPDLRLGGEPVIDHLAGVLA